MEQKRSLLDRMHQVDSVDLTRIVRIMLNDEHLVVDQWKRSAMNGAADGSLDTAVYQFQGTLRDDKRTWSVMLKSIREPKGSDGTADQGWKREYEIHQSGWLDTLKGGNLSAPRCYQAEEFPGECCWLWFEDVSDNLPRPWPLERFALAARHLGEFNGRFLHEKEPFRYPWFFRDVLRKQSAPVQSLMDNLGSKSYHPLSDRLLSNERCNRLRELWREKDGLISAIDRLPQTINHLDSFSRNLFDRENKTILIDWQWAGITAVGVDPTQIVSGSVAFNDLSVEQARILDPLIFEQYLEGLHDSGWDGDPRMVRFGYTAYAALHNLFRMLHVQNALKSEKGQASLQSKGGYSIDQHIEQWIKMFEFFDDLADEARRLAVELDFC